MHIIVYIPFWGRGDISIFSGIIRQESYVKSRQCIIKQRHHFANRGLYSQSYGFSNSHLWMWELDHEEGWALKNWCFWNVVLEKTLESNFDSKETKPVNPKGNQPWIFIGRTDAKDEVLILWPLWPPDAKSWLTGKDPKCWERLRARRWRDDRGWDGWMASLTQWTRVWANTGGYWRTEKDCGPWGGKESGVT